LGWVLIPIFGGGAGNTIWLTKAAPLKNKNWGLVAVDL